MASSQRGWMRVAAAADVPDECLREFSAGSRRIVVANYEGRFYALEAQCPHAAAPLREGRLVRSWIDCPWHHYLFDLATGENFYPKSVYPDDLKPTVAPLRVFPIREVEGQLEVELGEE